MIRTTRWTLAAGLIVALAGCAEREPEPEVQADAAEGAETTVTPADLNEWDVRFDDATAGPGGFQMTEAGAGWTIVTGASSAAVTWRPSDLLEGGASSVSATLVQKEAPADHVEGY